MQTLQAMLSTPEIQAITPDKETMKLKKEDLAKLLLGFYNWYKEQEKGESSVSTSDEQQQEVNYLSIQTGEVEEPEEWVNSLTEDSRYFEPEDEQPQSTKVVKPVTQTTVLQNTTQEKEKPVMKKEAIIVEVHSKEEFVNAVQNAMNEGRIETSNGSLSAVIVHIIEQNMRITMEFHVAIKDGQPIIVKFHLPQNIKLDEFIKSFAGSMSEKSKLLKRNVFTMYISPRIYEMLRKQIFSFVTNSSQREHMGKSNMLAVINMTEKGAVLKHKDKNTITPESIHLAINKA